MKSATRILGIYAADTSGVCSALYELGGLVVIHDASGCNSTYTTHDEPRWYRKDSAIVISALTEKDAILGNDDKFLRDVQNAADALHPRFLALCGSAMPFLMGTDFDALATLLERHTGIPTLALHTSGMRSYLVGAGEAFLAIAKRFLRPQSTAPGRRINLLGATPLDFSIGTTMTSIQDWLLRNGFTIQANLAYGGTFEQIAAITGANASLVLSFSGLPLAKYLEEHYGIPYLAGVPFGQYASVLAENLTRLCEGKTTSWWLKECDPNWMVIGESVSATSLANAIGLSCGKRPRVLCPLDSEPELLPEDALTISSEEEIEEALRPAQHVIADPLFKPVCNGIFHPLPHEAFSGRCFHSLNLDLIDKPLPKEFDLC